MIKLLIKVLDMITPIGVLAIVFILAMPLVAIAGHKYRLAQDKMIQELGYPANDVRIFCRTFDFELEDFAGSQMLQNQFKTYSTGETTELLDHQKEKLKRQKASNDSGTTGFIIGYGLGSAGK